MFISSYWKCCLNTIGSSTSFRYFATAVLSTKTKQAMTTNTNQTTKENYDFVKSEINWKKLPIMTHIRNYIERVQGGKYFAPRNIRIDRKKLKIFVNSPKSKRVNAEDSRIPQELMELYAYIFNNKKVKFIAAAAKRESIPHPHLILTGKLPLRNTEELKREYLPEVAFAGRSNVGKSSLLNSLVNSGGKARVGDKPGLTQSINFFDVSGYICFVDLPGYGFAFADTEKSKQWNELVRWFLYERFHHTKTLKRVFVLIDARHGLKASDYEFLQYLSINKIQNQIIFTKNDLISGNDLAKKLYAMELAMKNDEVTFRYTLPQVLLASSKSKSGIYDIQKIISSLIDPHRIAQLKKKLELKRMQNQVLF
jgi:ribosome biogenesis GTP-binding protein YsxC/EngB